MDAPPPDPSEQPPAGSSPTPPPYQPPPDAAASNARTFMMLCHLSAFAGIITPGITNIVGPFIVWIIKKDEMPEVDAHGKESMNFQISMTIYSIVSVILWFVIIGIPISAALVIFWLVMVIMASVKASEGVLYRYPLTIRFIK